MDKQMVANKTRSFYEQKCKFQKVKWNDVYSSEDEMILDLMQITVPADRTPPPYTFRGYEYIYSFASQLRKTRELSKSQITQCKRLALEIKIAYAIEHYAD